MNKDLKDIKLYQEELLEHYNYPKNRAKNIDELAQLKFIGLRQNPSCGDSVNIAIDVSDNLILNILFTGHGCVISQATASMLTQYCKNKEISFVKNLSSKDILNLISIELGPNRLKCAMLSLQALNDAIEMVAGNA